MIKKSLNRNQRSKGIKRKHVLQICLLLGVCFWLIYQVKHSHDKRKEFDEKDAKASVKAQSDDVILKFGRKDLPHEQEVSKNYKHEEEEEEENGVEEENKHDEEQEEKAKRLEEEEQEGTSKHDEEEQEEGSKHEEEEQEEGGKREEEEQEEGGKREEEEQEEASKHEEEEQEEVREDEGSKHEDEEQEAEIKDEEAEDERKGDGDDEVDENEQERADGEADHEEEFIDEKEREAEGDDKENEENKNEEKEGQEESGNLANDQNQDGGGRNAHEAREKHYKADDASSAVSHDTQIINSEVDKLDTENSNDNSTMNVLEQESKANTTEETNGDETKSELKVDEGKNSGGGSSLNVTYTKENDHETGSSNSEYISLPNATHTTDFIDQASNNSTEVSKETGNKPAEVNTEMPGSLQNETSAQKTTEDGMVTSAQTGSSKYEYISLPNATHTTDFIDQASNNSTEVSKETGNKPAEVNTEMPGSLQNETSAQKTTEDGMVTSAQTGSSKYEYISLPNATHTTDFIDQASNNSTEVSKETGNKPAEVNTEMPGSLQNETSAQKTTEDGMVTEEKYKEQVNETISKSKLPDSNTIDSSKIENVDLATRDSSNSSSNAESGMSEDIAKINAMAGGEGFGSSMTKEIIDSTQNEKSEGDNGSSGTDESLDTSSSNETADGGLHDPIDSSDNTLPQEEKDARVDLSTLPDITTEGINNQDAAAE